MERPVRSFDRRGIRTPTEMFAAEMCRKVGLCFRGIQPGFDDGNGKVHEPQILANNSYGSTFCVALRGCTEDRLAAEFERSNKSWERAMARAASRNLAEAA